MNRWLGLFTLLALLLVPACARETVTTEPEAEPQSLTIYSGRSEELVGPIFEAFEKKSGIDLKVKYGDTAELASTILEEGERSPADVFLSQDAGALGALQRDGLFDKLPAAITTRVPAKFRSASGLWVGITGRARVLVYNTERLKASDMPGSVLDLTQAKYKGKVGWAPTNGSFQSFVTALRKVKGQEPARQWLEAMKANGTKSYEKNSAIVKAVGSGEVDLGLVNHYYLVEIKKEDPAIKAANHFFNGDVGGLVNVSGAGVLKSSKNKKAALEFLEYLLSDEAQGSFAAGESEYPVVESVKASAELPPLETLSQPDIDLSDLDDLKGTLELLRQTGLL